MLSAEERASLLEEAGDPERRSVLRRFSRRRRGIPPPDYLDLLEAASELLAPRCRLERRRPRPDPSTFLL